MRRLAFRAMNALTWLCLALLCLVALVQCVTSLWGDHVWVARAWTDQPTRIDVETTWMGLRRQGVVWGRSVAAGRVAPSHPEWLDRTRRFLRGSIGPPGRRMRRWTTASYLTASTVWQLFPEVETLSFGGAREEALPWGRVLLGLGALPVSWMVIRAYLQGRAARREAMVGHCPCCSYDLTGNLSGACPECGTKIAQPAPT